MTEQPCSGDEFLDWGRLQQEFGDADIVRELADAFETESQQLLTTLAGSLAMKDAATARRAAHTLQGSARVFACTLVQDAALRVEHLAQQHQLDEAQAAYGKLLPLVDRLLAELKAAKARMD